MYEADLNHLQPEGVSEGKNETDWDGSGVAIIGPNERYQEQAARHLAESLHVVKQIPFYPESDQVPTIALMGNRVFLIDLDSERETALKLVSTFSQIHNAAVMVMSENPSTELIKRSMQAGAREILSLPLTRDQLDEAMDRAQSRINASSGKVLGSLCVFLGAKGGSGTTTIASNFAIAAALASEKSVLLIDFDLPLGDAVLGFGVRSGFSTLDALQSHHRLDATLLARYVAKHSSGLFILPAPGKYVRPEITREAVDKLILVARQRFDCVVLDAGTRFDLAETAVFHPEARIYLVSQPSNADLRNTNRILSQFDSGPNARNVQVVLNRDTCEVSANEEHVDEALAPSVQWRVPNDFKAVREMQNTGVPIAMKDSPITDAIGRMAREALNLPPAPEKKKNRLLGLFQGRLSLGPVTS